MTPRRWRPAPWFGAAALFVLLAGVPGGPVGGPQPGAALAQLGAALAQPGAGAQAGEERRQRLFSLPVTRTAADLARTAGEHLAHPARLDRALDDLQRLIEGHGGELLPESNERRRVHRGAGDWARERLAELGPAGWARYGERFGVEAQAALELALSAQDGPALVEVARRWPVAPQALRAWRAVGDLEFAAGNLEAAQAAWTRAESLAEGLGTLAPPGEESARAVRRAALERARTSAGAAALAPPPRSWTLDPGEGPLPLDELQGFQVALPEGPFSPERARVESYNLFPVAHGGRVFVSTGLRVLAVDGYDGSMLWEGDEADGWRHLSRMQRGDFFSGVDRGTATMAPAIGSGIVGGGAQAGIGHPAWSLKYASPLRARATANPPAGTSSAKRSAKRLV